MNRLTVFGLILAGAVILADRMISLSEWPAIILYTAAVILFVSGFIAENRKARGQQR